MRSDATTDGAAEPVERTVQLAGNSTFVVSLPKAWAVEQGLESGSSMYLYPQDDRLVVATETVSTPDPAVRIDARVRRRPSGSTGCRCGLPIRNHPR